MIKHTFDGRQIHISNMSHQHLSNSYYYTKIRYDNKLVRSIIDEDFGSWVLAERDAILDVYISEIKLRYDGVMLPYSPLASFPSEIAYLYRHNMIRENKIYHQDVCIGALPTGDSIINDIEELE